MGTERANFTDFENRGKLTKIALTIFFRSGDQKNKEICMSEKKFGGYSCTLNIFDDNDDR